jgi:hypothetical protein
MQKTITICSCLAIGACFLTSVSCRAPISREELIGKYVRTTDSYGRETLELKANGQYRHVFSLNGQVIHNTGSWELTRDEEPAEHVTLESFRRPETPGRIATGDYYVERSLGGLIKIGLEEFQCFYKQKASP